MNTPARPGRVAIVGGGITGLLVARRLSRAGVDVVVLEGSDRLGGQIRTVDLAGRRVDVGAEAVHLLSPAGRGLVEELGVAGEIVGSAPGASLIRTPRGLRRLPAGVGPAGPTKLLPVLRSGVLSLGGLVRAGCEPLLALVRRPLRLGPGRDVSVGAFTSARFGREVTARFVDPLLGGLHSGDVDRLSLRACVPTLAPAATSRRSLVLRRRPATTTKPTRPAGGSNRTTTPGGSVTPASPEAGATPRAQEAPGTQTPGVAPAASTPAPTPGGGGTAGAPPITFASFPTGLHTLVDRVAADIAGPVRTGARVEALGRDGDGYALRLADGGVERADAVVLAIPAHAARPLLAPLSPAAESALAGTEFATTAAVVLAYRREDVAGVAALAGTGILVPRDAGGLLKAATHLSTKWPHLAPRGADDPYLLRLSAGRAGQDVVSGLSDDELVARLRADLARLTGLDAEPIAVHVQRWDPGLPQLTVGHLDRLAAARGALRHDAPGVHLAGASYDGVGLTSCIASADAVAAELLGG